MNHRWRSLELDDLLSFSEEISCNLSLSAVVTRYRLTFSSRLPDVDVCHRMFLRLNQCLNGPFSLCTNCCTHAGSEEAGSEGRQLWSLYFNVLLSVHNMAHGATWVQVHKNREDGAGLRVTSGAQSPGNTDTSQPLPRLSRDALLPGLFFLLLGLPSWTILPFCSCFFQVHRLPRPDWTMRIFIQTAAFDGSSSPGHYVR